ncbi:hypothetical protein GCM10018779_67110 [Streptomyces griseocarneus]|nr:hypothetical protein GCM10018779_67110 [Streptomyces griseocarneus]
MSAPAPRLSAILFAGLILENADGEILLALRAQGYRSQRLRC